MEYLFFGSGACFAGLVSGVALQVSLLNGEYSKAWWVATLFLVLVLTLLGLCIWAFVSVGLLAALEVVAVGFVAQGRGMKLLKSIASK